MTTQKHTATPWIIHPWDSDTILDAETFFCGRGSNHANAAYIVQAVNAHAALVEALQKIADGEAGPLEGRKDPLWRQTVAENALRNAGLALASKGA